MAYSPDGQTLLTCGDKAARLWDFASGKPIGSPLLGVAVYVAFSPEWADDPRGKRGPNGPGVGRGNRKTGGPPLDISTA